MDSGTTLNGASVVTVESECEGGCAIGSTSIFTVR